MSSTQCICTVVFAFETIICFCGQVGTYKEVSSHTIHKTDRPGITCVDIDLRDSNRVCVGVGVWVRVVECMVGGKCILRVWIWIVCMGVADGIGGQCVDVIDKCGGLSYCFRCQAWGSVTRCDDE